MKELREFIKGLEGLDYEIVSISEVGEEGTKLIGIKDIRKEVEEIGVKEVTDVYFHSFEFFSKDNRYMTIDVIA